MVSFCYVRSRLEQDAPSERGECWTSSCADADPQALWHVFDSYLMYQTGGRFDGIPARYFIKVGGWNDASPRCFRLTIEDRNVVVEHCDSRHLIHFVDNKLGAELMKRLADHHQSIADGWTYLGGGLMVADPWGRSFRL
ncbi:MAG: hypothetical protein NUV56_03165 [Candidatus Uhrbacteria bacterium]|nr:hypothetical protein [Candidatus Uhrbacteria bacterium]